MGKNNWDVLITGAGPAGSFLGYLLASEGIKVLIIDKKSFPRYKPCAGGLTQKAVRLLPFDMENIFEDKSYKVKISVNNRPAFDKTFDNPVIHMVTRDKFDLFLVEKAVKAGAKFHDDAGFVSLWGEPGNLVIQTTKGQIKAGFIIGADGVNSKVSRALGLSIKKETMHAIEGEVLCKDKSFHNSFTGSVHFDFAALPYGYGWIFPKSGYLSAGVLTTSKKIKGLKKYFRSYLTSKGFNSSSANIYRVKGHQIPFNPHPDNRLSTKMGLVAGDAAGYTDPVTGEGIYYALLEAIMASKVILKAFSLSEPAFISAYDAIIKDEFLYETIYATKIARLFFAWPQLSRLILKTKGERWASSFLDLMAGKKTYRQFYRELFNPVEWFKV